GEMAPLIRWPFRSKLLPFREAGRKVKTLLSFAAADKPRSSVSAAAPGPSLPQTMGRRETNHSFLTQGAPGNPELPPYFLIPARLLDRQIAGSISLKSPQCPRHLVLSQWKRYDRSTYQEIAEQERGFRKTMWPVPRPCTSASASARQRAMGSVASRALIPTCRDAGSRLTAPDAASKNGFLILPLKGLKIRYMQKMGMTEDDKRNCCLLEIQETEAKYYRTLEDIEKVGVAAGATQDPCLLGDAVTEQGLRAAECSLKVQGGKFKLQDLLVVPMQRVLKYHLLLKRGPANPLPASVVSQDLAMYINEVKRDKETLKKISEFQSSIENLQVKLEEFGRPKIDGELKVRSIVNHTKQDRYLFLFDKVVIVCKRRGYSYELKEIIELLFHKMTDDPMNNKDVKKWSYGFYLIHLQGKQGFQFFCKTEDMKRKWMEQFEMAMSNIKPDKANANHHSFQMYTFDKTTNCKACRMFLRGTFYQGYLCTKCGVGAHKECLEVTPPCKISETPLERGQTGDVIELLRGDPESQWWEGRLVQTRKSGYFPSSSVKPCPVDGRPPISRPPSRDMDYAVYPWFAGNMERQQTDNLLKSHASGTYLIRERPAEAERFAISIKFNDEVKHIKVVEKDSWVHITEAKKFESLLVCDPAAPAGPSPRELVEYYQCHSLKESFKQLDTTLKYPYKSRERVASRASTRSPGNTRARKASAVFTPRVIGTAGETNGRVSGSGPSSWAPRGLRLPAVLGK
ncbi:hypothetical protein E2I00_001757, partial [Balaenoptera physalus]